MIETKDIPVGAKVKFAGFLFIYKYYERSTLVLEQPPKGKQKGIVVRIPDGKTFEKNEDEDFYTLVESE